jgi:hypothetical protein
MENAYLSSHMDTSRTENVREGILHYVNKVFLTTTTINLVLADQSIQLTNEKHCFPHTNSKMDQGLFCPLWRRQM